MIQCNSQPHLAEKHLPLQLRPPPKRAPPRCIVQLRSVLGSCPGVAMGRWMVSKSGLSFSPAAPMPSGAGCWFQGGKRPLSGNHSGPKKRWISLDKHLSRDTSTIWSAYTINLPWYTSKTKIKWIRMNSTHKSQNQSTNVSPDTTINNIRSIFQHQKWNWNHRILISFPQQETTYL